MEDIYSNELRKLFITRMVSVTTAALIIIISHYEMIINSMLAQYLRNIYQLY